MYVVFRAFLSNNQGETSKIFEKTWSIHKIVVPLHPLFVRAVGAREHLCLTI